MIIECDKWQDFLTCKFSNEYLELESGNVSQNCKHAVAETEIEGVEKAECRECNECLNFFNNKLTKILNDASYYNKNEDTILKEIEKMKTTIDPFTTMFRNYMGHRVRAFSQFAAIKKLYSESSESNAMIIVDHKQKTLEMHFREGQVQYFGKVGMSLLGFMLIFREIRYCEKTKKRKSGLVKYHFDFMFENYNSQNHLQVMSALQTILPILKEKFPLIRTTTLVSDNASCFASHDGIPFIHYLNKYLATVYHPPRLPIRINRWLFAEASAGKDEEDTHFSFVNSQFCSYALDGNNITTEADVFAALQFQGGLAGSNTALLNGTGLTNHDHIYEASQTKKEFKGKTKVRATHDIQWNDIDENSNLPPVTACSISNITKAEKIKLKRLQNFMTKRLNVTLTEDNNFTSPKPPRFQFDPEREGGNPAEIEKKLVSNTKAHAIKSAMDESGLEFGIELVRENAKNDEVVPYSGLFPIGWARAPKVPRSEHPFRHHATLALHKLWEGGNISKAKKLSAERARKNLVQSTILTQWDERLSLTIPKIKAFFQKSQYTMNTLV